MRKFALTAGGVSLSAALAFSIAPAHAAILWVMIVGTDNASCGPFPTPFTPCLTLQQAVTNAQAGDTIVLDLPYDYGPATINKSLHIFARSIGAGTYSPSGVPCLTISGINTIVRVTQYTCDQGGAAQPGIQVNSAKSVQLLDTTLRGGSGAACGILFRPDNNSSMLTIEKSTIEKFGTTTGGAVCLLPRSSASVSAALRGVNVQSNRYGIMATTNASTTVQAVIDSASISGSTVALRSNGVNTTLAVRDSTISNNATALSHLTNSKMESLGGNILLDNTTKGSFTATRPQQ
jgi:hypothetical protein